MLVDNPLMVKTESIIKSFPVGNTNYETLHGISVEIYEGSFTIIYGPSGSGKSTLLNCLLGIDVIDKGKIWVEGNRIDSMSEDERATLRSDYFGVVYQQPIWIKSLSVLENVALPLVIRGHSIKKSNFMAMDFLKKVGMDIYAKRKPMEISGGEQQKVGLARALIHNPKILVLDEPTGNLDTHSSDEVMNLLQALNIKEKRTIIMVTHNLIYLPFANQTIVIQDGLVSEKDSTNRLMTDVLKGKNNETN